MFPYWVASVDFSKYECSQCIDRRLALIQFVTKLLTNFLLVLVGLTDELEHSKLIICVIGYYYMPQHTYRSMFVEYDIFQ